MTSESSILIEIHKKVQAKVDEYSVAGGKWGKPLPLNPNAPIYPLFPEGDASGLGFVDTIAKFGRTGVYVGAAYGGGKITPTFKFEEFDLTKPDDWLKFNAEFNKYRPAGDGRGDGEFYVKPRELAPRSKFDAVAETHDLLQQEANLKYAEAYARAGAEYQSLLRQGADAATLKAAADKVVQAKQAAVDGQRKEYAESDGWITYELNRLTPGNPYEAVLKNIGGIVFATNFASEFIDQVGLKNAELAEKLGEAYGSKLGALIAGDGFFEQKFGLGTSIGAELGKSVANYFLVGTQVNLTDSLLSKLGPDQLLVGLVDKTLDDFGIKIVGELNPASFKGTANILLAEAAERLGLKGFENYVFTETGQSITNYLLDSLSGGEVEAQGFAAVITGDFNMSSIGGFLVDLAAKYTINNYMSSILNSARGLVSIDNRYEGYYAEIHAMAGQIIGTTIGTILTGPFFGSIIGKIAGTIGYIIGSISYETLDTLTFGLLDDWFTPNPVGVNYAVFNAATNRLEIDFRGSEVHWDRNGSSRTEFIKLWQIGNAGSDAYASYVNGVIESIEAYIDTSQFSQVLERGTRFNHASIGYHDHAFQVIRSAPGDKVHSQNMNAIVSAAVEYEMSKLIFQGGDLVQVRAIDLWKGDTAMKVGGTGRGDADYILSANLLGARLQIAKDYRFYLENTETINYMMAHSPDSPFTVGWTATLLQAHAMRLDAPFQVLSRTALNNMATAKNDTIYAADGNDRLYGADGHDLIKTYGGDDVVGGGNGNDTIHAGTGKDIIYGEAGNDEIWLGAGHDTVSGGLGNDVIDGGGGIDVAYIDAKFSAVSITRDGSRLLTSGPQGTDTYTGVELLIFEGGRVFINTTRKIGGFDEGFYLDHNPDVAAAVKAGMIKSGYEHWTKWGKSEGRNAIDATANPYYDETFYLAANPDVADAVLSGKIVNGYAHYEKWGKAEGRDSVPLFDKVYYLSRNPDVKASGMDPWTHYMKYGWREGRDPSAFFDTSAYLDQNPDVKVAGVNPFEHAQFYGFAEGRTVLATPEFALFSNYPLI